MTSARFGFQAIVVLSLVALVSWPEQRQVRAGDFWDAVDAATRRPDISKAFGSRRAEGRYGIAYGTASEARLGATAAAALHRKLYAHDLEGRRRSAPSALYALGGKVNGILGYVHGPRNTPIASARLLLRNVETGQVEAPAVADEYGRFAFLDVMPSVYLVELLDAKGRVIGVSDLISVGINELREASVRVSGRTTLASFGGALRPAAHATVTAAANQGVNRVAAASRCASPPCDNPNQ
jgi:hypothetical protein